MASRVLNRFIALGDPIEVLVGGGSILPHPRGRAAVTISLTPGEQKAQERLNLRRSGYGTEAAKACWLWLTCTAHESGEKFLTLHLLFPFVYGGTLAANLWWVWVAVGRPFHPAWIMAPLAMMLAAEWTEHFIQRAQLRPYVSSNDDPLPTLWIQISSCATMVKLWLTFGLYVSLVGLVVKLIVSLSERHLVVDAAE